jgi:hypothetical protein
LISKTVSFIEKEIPEKKAKAKGWPAGQVGQ